MKKCLVISFLCMFLATQFLYAEDFSEAEQKKIREYPQSVVNRIEKHDVRDLIQDEYFLQTLSAELKNKTRKSEDKVYFFYLMLQKIGWAFCGGISIPSPFDYAGFSILHINTLNSYREELSSLGIDSKQFFHLAFKNTDTKPILASYAFLLGSLLESDVSVIYNICENAYKNDFFAKPTLFRAMLIHNMMLVSPAMVITTTKQNYDEYSDFVLFIQKIFNQYELKEEEKEDLILSIIVDNNYGTFITNKILDEKNSENDLFVLTSATLVAVRLKSKELFQTFIELWETHETEDWKKKIITQIKANDYNVEYYYGINFPDGYSFSKSWDDVSLTAYDNGWLFEYNGYSEFIPRNKP